MDSGFPEGNTACMPIHFGAVVPSVHTPPTVQPQLTDSEVVQSLRDVLQASINENRSLKAQNHALSEEIDALQDSKVTEVSKLQEELKIRDELLQKEIKKRRAGTTAYVDTLYLLTKKELERKLCQQHSWRDYHQQSHLCIQENHLMSLNQTLHSTSDESRALKEEIQTLEDKSFEKTQINLMMLNIKQAKLQDQIKEDESEKILDDQGCCRYFGIKTLPLSVLVDDLRQSEHSGIKSAPSFVWMDNQARSQYYGIRSVSLTQIFTDIGDTLQCSMQESEAPKERNKALKNSMFEQTETDVFKLNIKKAKKKKEELNLQESQEKKNMEEEGKEKKEEEEKGQIKCELDLLQTKELIWAEEMKNWLEDKKEDVATTTFYYIST